MAFKQMQKSNCGQTFTEPFNVADKEPDFYLVAKATLDLKKPWSVTDLVRKGIHQSRKDEKQSIATIGHSGLVLPR